MRESVTSKDFSPEQTRAIRLALAVFGCRMEILSRCGESPAQAMEATLRDIRMSPSLLAEWILHEPGVNDDLPELFRRHGKLLWRVLLSVKCDAGQRIFRGEEAQQAIRNAVSEYSPSRDGVIRSPQTPDGSPVHAVDPDHTQTHAIIPKQSTCDAHAVPSFPEVGNERPTRCSACGKPTCLAAAAGAKAARSVTRIHAMRAMLAAREPTLWRWAFAQLRSEETPVPSSQAKVCFLVSLAEAIKVTPRAIQGIREMFESEMR